MTAEAGVNCSYEAKTGKGGDSPGLPIELNDPLLLVWLDTEDIEGVLRSLASCGAMKGNPAPELAR